jgi:hypothetical protein
MVTTLLHVERDRREGLDAFSPGNYYAEIAVSPPPAAGYVSAMEVT